jgi:hypothetical protein
MNTHKRSEIHARIPQDHFLKLQKIATDRKVGISDVIREAVKDFLIKLLVLETEKINQSKHDELFEENQRLKNEIITLRSEIDSNFLNESLDSYAIYARAVAPILNNDSDENDDEVNWI